MTQAHSHDKHIGLGANCNRVDARQCSLGLVISLQEAVGGAVIWGAQGETGKEK